MPAVATVLRVEPSGGDDTGLLQAALDAVGQLPVRADGFRGALELAGHFRVSGQLKIRTAGIAVRGRGAAAAGEPATITATGRARRTLITIRGTPAVEAAAIPVLDETVPAGPRELRLSSLDGLAPGARVVVRRPSTKAWIEALGMDEFEGPGAFADMRVVWRPGSRDLVWDRTVTDVDAANGRVTLDAPITTALEARFGGGTVALARPADGPVVANVGIENVRLVSAYDRDHPADEEHAWIGLSIDAADDVWVRGVEFRHFAGSAVRVGPRARRVTIAGCRNLAPVSEIGGYRRQAFLVEGQQVLVRHCVAEEGMNDFAVGQLTGGPVVFLDCVAQRAHGDSGSFESWASGVLYENVRIEGAGLRLTKDWTRAQGGGWTAANCVLWNCQADRFAVQGPESAPNQVVRSPGSLWAEQRRAKPDRGSTPATRPASAATGERAPLFKWDPPSPPARVSAPDVAPLEIVNGRFVIDGKTLWGGYVDENWWRGQTYPAIAERLGGRSVTRFVPGRIGPGLTEDLPAMARDYRDANYTMFFGGVGLWYDRRRDDHTVAANDRNVWAPFYEMPWARTGRGQAWDGLTLFDLGTFNPWFFDRTRAFSAELARQGIVHHHYLYNTHNLLETQSHWVDFPWRPANNVNETRLPEPPPLDPRNTVHLANVFYNTDHAGRRELHRRYIFHTLDQLADARNIIFSVGAQFAGPLEFQQFFIDTVAEWEQRTGTDVRVALATSKDITDAIMADPVRFRQVVLIDMRYWQYRPDGPMWAPRGDRNRAFREMTSEQFGALSDTPPPTTPWLAYKQVREYRDRFPDRALVVWHNGVHPAPALMAGAAQVIMRYRAFQMRNEDIAQSKPFDAFVREELADVLMTMAPRDGWLEEPERNWCLADAQGRNVLFYSVAGEHLVLARDLPAAPLTATWVNPRTGQRRPLAQPVHGKRGEQFEKPDRESWLLWIRCARRTASETPSARCSAGRTAVLASN